MVIAVFAISGGVACPVHEDISVDETCHIDG